MKLKTPVLELFDETLDINSTENYELSVQLSLEGFSFCLLDTIRNKFILLRTFEPEENKYFNTDSVNEILEKDDFLSRQYKKVNIITPSPKFTLIPPPLFDPGKKDEYFSLNHIKEETDIIISNRIIDPDIYIVFSINRPFNDLINTFFPGIHPHHHLIPIFNHMSHSMNSVPGNYIHLNIEKEYFNLIIFNSNTLKFCNTFVYRNISDILYFVLNVFKNMKIEQEETIYFSGLTEKYDDLYSTFSSYIRKIKFSEPSGNFSFSYVFNETNLHQFMNLFNTVNCE
jgi:uncharacterized protein DUF3822